jgi:GPH family glycoside/pentoside/hexuronide:cation symporter
MSSPIGGELPIAEETPSVRIDISYALVTLGSSAIWSIIGGWLLYFYLPPAGEGAPLVPATLYSGTMFATRVVNALIAPPIGYLSDHTRSRWGRRLPYMFLSALPMLALFVLLWTPPLDGVSLWNLVYLTVIHLLYSVAYAFNQIPYTALLPELAVTNQHRVRISAWASSFMLIGMIVGGFAGPLIEAGNYVVMAVAYALFTLPTFYLPFLVLRERPERQIEAHRRLKLGPSLRIMLKNRPFVVMTATGFFYWGTTTFIQAAIPFIATEICLMSKGDTLYFYAPALFASLACYPLVTWLANRFGKTRIFSLSLILSALVLPSLMLIGRWIPLPLAVQGIGWVTLQAAALSGVVMLPMAFGADIVDQDEQLTGQRREGLYYAVWGLLDQVVNALAAALLPLFLLLGRSRTDPQGPLGVRVIGLAGGVMLFIAFLIFQQYPMRDRKALSPSQGVQE